MKVYAVLDDLYYLDDDNPISGLFVNREDAERHLIEKAEADFERNFVRTEDRKYEYNDNGDLWYIHDDSRGDVSWYIKENELR